MSDPAVIVIAGPTASGKSALALELAGFRRHDVNADSMQVYRDLPSSPRGHAEDDAAGAPHRLYGHVDAAEPARSAAGGAGAGRDRSAQAVCPSWSAAPGSYCRRCTSGLAAIPPIPPMVRADVEETVRRWAVAPLFAEPLELDPVIARRWMPK